MELAGMDYFCDQVQQKDVGRRMQVGQELLEYLGDPARSTDLEQDQQRLDKVIDELTAWVNSSNFKVRL
ncbi:CLAP1 protein, partial [Semnornis frantzii]|nr:CLAP1 protein [Semnornis frantzii]